MAIGDLQAEQMHQAQFASDPGTSRNGMQPVALFRTCEVLVGVDYFDYQGRRYKSLSSIAKAITGTNRNGWAFFGLVSARSAG